MQFRLLGPLVVSDGDTDIPVRGDKVRALLAALLLDANTAVSTASPRRCGESVRRPRRPPPCRTTSCG
jgi:hypothetical protein